LSDGRLRRPAAVRYAPRPVASSVESWVLLPEDRIGTWLDPKTGKRRPYEERQKSGDLFPRVPGSRGRVVVTAQSNLTDAWLVVTTGKDEAVTRKVPMLERGKADGDPKAVAFEFLFEPNDSGYEAHFIDENG